MPFLQKDNPLLPGLGDPFSLSAGETLTRVIRCGERAGDLPWAAIAIVMGYIAHTYLDVATVVRYAKAEQVAGVRIACSFQYGSQLRIDRFWSTGINHAIGIRPVAFYTWKDQIVFVRANQVSNENARR